MQKSEDGGGIACPKCGARTWVRDSRPTTMAGKVNQHSAAELIGVRRRRRCYGCDFRFTTYELPISVLKALTVQKRVVGQIREAAESLAALATALAVANIEEEEADDECGADAARRDHARLS